MEVRIGTTLDGQPARFDTSSTRPLLLVGDVGRGKTTIARHLTRWWLADTARHAHVFAEAPSEWADLNYEREYPALLGKSVDRDCRPGSCLVVVDDLDLLPDAAIALLRLGPAPVILTSHGGTNFPSQALFATGVTCLGLIRPKPSDPGEAAILEGQGRLDWPMGTVAVVPAQRGPLDFPCHRWHAPASEWATGEWAVAR